VALSVIVLSDRAQLGLVAAGATAGLAAVYWVLG